jgi:hypothetical protein
VSKPKPQKPKPPPKPQTQPAVATPPTAPSPLAESSKLLLLAARMVPFVKYAVAVAGICAAIAVVGALGLDLRIAGFGAVVMLFMMVAVFTASRLSTSSGRFVRYVAYFYVLVAALLMSATALFMLTLVFFSWPLDLRHWLTSRVVAEFPHAEVRPDGKSATVKVETDVPVTENVPADEILQKIPALMAEVKKGISMLGEGNERSQTIREVRYKDDAKRTLMITVEVRSRHRWPALNVTVYDFTTTVTYEMQLPK